MPIQERYIFGDEILEDDRLIISLQNRAFRYGDGIFETILVRDGRAEALEMHMSRFSRGAEILGLEGIGTSFAQKVDQLVEKLLKAQPLDGYGRMRVTAYRQDGGTYLPANNRLQLLGEIKPLLHDPWMVREPQKVCFARQFLLGYSVLSAAKSLNALTYVLAAKHAQAQGCDDAILLHHDGQLAELSAANLFLVIDDNLHTPPLSSGCLPGTMRARVLQTATTLGLRVSEAPIYPEDLEKATEAFSTNAIQGLQPIAHVLATSYHSQNFTMMDALRAAIMN